MSEEKKSIKGGEFIIKEAKVEDIFIAENWADRKSVV